MKAMPLDASSGSTMASGFEVSFPENRKNRFPSIHLRSLHRGDTCYSDIPMLDTFN